MIGLLSYVQRDTFSSRLVADAAAGATTLFVEQAQVFDVNGGTVRLGEDAMVAYMTADAVAETVTLTVGLPAAFETDTPVVEMTADGEAATWTAYVNADPTSAEDLPATIPTALVPAFREGTVQAGSKVEFDVGPDGFYRVTSRPDEPVVIDGTLIDPTTLPASDGTPTTAPDSSPTPQPFQASGTVAVNWDPPAAATTHVRMFLAPAVTNSDGTGSIDTSVTPGSGNLYSDNVQPVATLSTLTLGGEALDPALHYQVALQAWNEIGDAPASGWVLCQPGFIADAVITYLLLAEQVNANGIAIASTPGASYSQPFSGSALPSGWAATYRNNNDGLAYRSDGLTVSVVSSGVPSGTDGAALKIDPGTYVGRNSAYVGPASTSVADFVIDVRFQFDTDAAWDYDTDRVYFGARSQETEPDWELRDSGVALVINRRYSQWYIDTPDTNYLVSSAVQGQKNSDNSMKAGVWYRARLSCLRGLVAGAVWSEDSAMPALDEGDTAVSLTAGNPFISRGHGNLDSGQTPPVLWVDYINVTAYSTGFQVLPDATGDWPQVLDPIRNRVTAAEDKNAAQDGRLTTNESAIASLGGRATALEQPTHIGLRGDGSLQTIPNAAWTALNVPTTLFVNGSWSPASSVVTIPSAGIYTAEGFVNWGASAAGRRIMRVETFTGTDPGAGNGTTVVSDERSAISYTLNLGVSNGYVFNAGDKVRLIGYQSSGGNLSTFTTGGLVPRLTLRKVSST